MKPKPYIDDNTLVVLIADRCYTELCCVDNSTEVISKNLKYMEERLPKGMFIRCHAKYLVNRRHIVAVDAKNKYILLSDMRKIPIAHRRLADVFNSYYHFFK